jgi:hypothetical protein
MQFKKDRRKRERDKAISGIICFVCIFGIMAIVLFFAIEHIRNTRRTTLIAEHLKSCPKSSVVDYRFGEPFVNYKGRKVMIEREECKP